MAQTIQQLARDLYYLPIEIYQYVVNTIDFQPYSGEMKGPLATLQTQAGNDWDTDSLLAALLGDAGVPAADINYVSGAATWPAANATGTGLDNYLGVTSPAAAEEPRQRWALREGDHVQWHHGDHVPTAPGCEATIGE